MTKPIENENMIRYSAAKAAELAEITNMPFIAGQAYRAIDILDVLRGYSRLVNCPTLTEDLQPSMKPMFVKNDNLDSLLP